MKIETRYRGFIVACSLTALLLGSCASSYTTSRDKTAKGAGIGAAVGAIGALAAGKREADEILAGAAIGAVAGGGVGAYMDHQEERLARIPGTRVERVSDDTLLVHLASDVLFDVDSASLDAGARAILDDTVGVLREFDKTAIVIQGHTDSTGSEAHNLELSQRRASAVEAYLISRGIDPARVSAVGHGEAFPLADNSTEAGRRLNRRVGIMLRARAV